MLNIPGAKDPDEFIKKYGRERFEALLNGTSNAIEYKLAKVREKYDLARPADRVEYIKDAIRLLAGRLTPTEREVYAGRLAEETDVAKANVMAQLEAAVRANQRRAQRQREKELLNTGAGADIKLPYNVPGGEKALGVASAEQQLVAALIRDPSLIPMAESRVKPEQFLMEDMAAAYAAVLEAKRQGHLPDLATLASALPEETVSRLSLLLARNYDVGLGRRDVEMYLDRLEQSVPQSSKAGGMTGEELEEYMERLRRKKS